jgi:hypothetical protein
MCNVSKNISRIQRVSGTFQAIFTVLFFSVPLVNLVYWTLFNHLPVGLTEQLLPVSINRPLSVATLAIAVIVSFIPIFVALFGIVNLKKLFALYEKEIIFSNQNAVYILRFGYSLIAWVVANIVFIALISIVLTFNGSSDDRMVVFQFSAQDFAMLIIATVVVLISWVMKEATVLNDEQKYTV